jgi:hypothetical protein
MLSIEFCDVVETLEIGELFEQVGFSNDSNPSDDSGDSYVENVWGIETLSLDMYYPVEGFRWTKPERQVKLFHRSTKIVLEDCVPFLQCSPEHIIMRKNGDVNEWVKVEDLQNNNLILTREGWRRCVSVETVNEIERLCDMQVSIAHSYFADNVLSHNSHFLTALGVNALINNINVLHYTFELSEAAVGRRYDSNLCDIDSNNVIAEKDSIIEKYKSMSLGGLKIKYFPTNSASIYTLRSHMERLELKGFKPGLVLIDYADIMRSTRQYDSLRHELKLVYEELRGFAGEKKLPVWTASQANKESANSDLVDLGNMSEAYGKAMVADVVLSISRRAHEKSSGYGRIFVAKNRAGRDGIVFPIRIDTSKSKFEIIGKAASPDDARSEDEVGLKGALKKKWEELKNDDTLQRPSDTIS